MAVLAQKEWTPKTMDIKTAFLQGHELDRQVYIKLPKEAEETGKLWLLKKCVYGLADASLQWYRRVDCMLALGARVFKQDPAVFFWIDREGVVQGVLAVHVDDFLFGGTEAFEKRVMENVRKEFLVGKEEISCFQYTGMNISHISGVESEIRFDQNFYASSLEQILVTKERGLQKDNLLTEAEKTMIRAKVGQLLWIGRHSRPDLLFDTCVLASRIKEGTVKDLLETNKVIRKAKSEKLTLHYRKLENSALVVYSDASLGNLLNGGTQGAYLIGLLGQEGYFSPICWSSKKVRRVVRSTLAGETLAMADDVDSGIYVASLYSELMCGSFDKSLKIICLTDCKSLYEAVKSQKSVREKRLRIEISGLKESLEQGWIDGLNWISTKDQLADCLTKKGASPVKLMSVLERGRLE